MTLLNERILPALALVAGIFLYSATTPSWSQEKYPSRPIEMIVAFSRRRFRRRDR